MARRLQKASRKGRGVPQGYAEAMKWYRKATEQRYGDATAQYNLGLMYGKGADADHGADDHA